MDKKKTIITILLGILAMICIIIIGISTYKVGTEWSKNVKEQQGSQANHEGLRKKSSQLPRKMKEFNKKYN